MNFTNEAFIAAADGMISMIDQILQTLGTKTTTKYYTFDIVTDVKTDFGEFIVLGARNCSLSF